MSRVSADSSFRYTCETMILLLNSALLLVPSLAIGLTSTVDASTYVVTLLSIFLCALDGLLDLHSRNTFPTWLRSEEDRLFQLSLVMLMLTLVLSFSFTLAVSFILSTSFGGTIAVLLSVGLLATITPYLCLRIGTSYRMTVVAHEARAIPNAGMHDFISPMLRRIRS